MINRAIFCTSLTKTELKQIIALKPYEGKHWDTPPNDDIKSIKDKIRQQLEDHQAVCSYCGLKLGGTSKGEIEHIAPKAYFRHPEFTFTLKNLTLACHLCNGSDKKHTKETIGVKRKIYSKCSFLIVHPYFDDPNEHYEWTENEFRVLIQVKNDSPQGRFSINLFKLDTPIMSELRAGQVIIERKKAAMPLEAADEQLLKAALEYNE